jgi:hypothetical protein
VDDETHRLKSIIESTSAALDEVRRLDDPATAGLIQDLERTRAEAVAELAAIGGRFAATESHRTAS